MTTSFARGSAALPSAWATVACSSLKTIKTLSSAAIARHSTAASAAAMRLGAINGASSMPFDPHEQVSTYELSSLMPQPNKASPRAKSDFPPLGPHRGVGRVEESSNRRLPQQSAFCVCEQWVRPRDKGRPSPTLAGSRPARRPGDPRRHPALGQRRQRPPC
jgi:hypothetical protein